MCGGKGGLGQGQLLRQRANHDFTRHSNLDAHDTKNLPFGPSYLGERPPTILVVDHGNRRTRDNFSLSHGRGAIGSPFLLSLSFPPSPFPLHILLPPLLSPPDGTSQRLRATIASPSIYLPGPGRSSLQGHDRLCMASRGRLIGHEPVDLQADPCGRTWMVCGCLVSGARRSRCMMHCHLHHPVPCFASLGNHFLFPRSSSSETRPS